MSIDLNINSRQEKLIRFLLSKKYPITVKELADKLDVSTRTVQREFKQINSLLLPFDLKLMRKLGVGIKIEGSEEGRNRLLDLLAETGADVIYTPKERQQGIICELLLNSEPTKLFTFSNKYKVTEATISNDLDHIEEWLISLNVKLVRKPGLGVYVTGTEKNIRMAAAQIFHMGISIDKWLEIIYSSNQDDSIYNHKLPLTQNNPLLNNEHIHIPDVIYVERVLKEVIETQTEIKPSDRDYINMIIHLALSIDRIRHGEFVIDEDIMKFVKDDYYPLALEIATKIEAYINIKIPEVEVAYIAMHLYGITLISENNIDDEYFYWLDIAKSFVKVIEGKLFIDLSKDQSLIDGLVTHLIPTISRLRLGLQIHNPMLEYVQEHYSQVFDACKEGCKQITIKTGLIIPDSEVGYLATHIGATMLKVGENKIQQSKVVIVCASGFGTSRFLASKLQLEFPNIHIENIISVSMLPEWLEVNNQRHEIDFVITTVALPSPPNIKMIFVNPFLLERDLQLIKDTLAEVREAHPRNDRMVIKKEDMKVFAAYGEAMLQILRNLTLIEEFEASSELIPSIVKELSVNPIVKNSQYLRKDLEKREELGGFILGKLLMLHAKTEGVSELLTVVIRLKRPFRSVNENGIDIEVSLILLLAVPAGAGMEHIAMVSEISASLVDDSFIHSLAVHNSEEVKNSLERILSNVLDEKIKQRQN
ncbi:PRD domain-containing protein [Bacillus sp. FJAT-50079]|uniref:BglG family transcription antiterminator n=1 Tax=Bacillus sp. FJAT-50079 TaxID=2833577 RepID=UPI001BC9F643|nr:PRD domain-containing protein [Bacillus sp. FJAT-50079]MBS4206867.1 PRD domain-containing protein [Bacillus sp. FJAT-50079]